MSRIKVPEDVTTSPHDGSALTLDVDTQTFSDAHGNVWTVSDLAASLPNSTSCGGFVRTIRNGGSSECTGTSNNCEPL